MFKTIINSYIKAVLRDLFEDAAKENMKLSFGDLFSKTDLVLNNLTLRPDAFDVGLYPLKLVSGHLSKLHVEGIAEAYMGGRVKVLLENLFLLFKIDTNADPEQIQIMKKILLEMKYETISQTLWKELMQRIQGIQMGTPDYKKQRKQMVRMIKNMFKNINIIVKSVHIRIEVPTPSSSGPPRCIALGCTLPQFVIQPNSNGGGTSLRGKLSKNDNALSFVLKSLQVYCDYDSESYTSNGATHPTILREFMKRYSTEKHTALLLPFDLEIVVAANLRSKSGIITPQVGINIPALRIACDSRQIEALNDLLDLAIYGHRRSKILLRVPLTYNEKKIPPFVFDVGGVHLLPSLYIGGVKYPDDMKLPRSANTSRIKSYMKAKAGNWAREMWRFAIRMIIEDLRLIRPLGRWIELIKLPILRRKYAFYFSKLLKKSTETGDYILDVKGTLDPFILNQLYAIEMTLPINTILMFRTFGVMVCAVKEFNDRYRQAKGIQKGATAAAADKSKLLQWKDIVRIHSEVLETYRALEREDDLDNLDDDDVDDVDDTVSALTDDVSTYSSPHHPKRTQSPQRSAPDASLLSKQLGNFNLLNKAKSALTRKSSGGLAGIHEDYDESDAHSQSSRESKTPPKASLQSSLMSSIAMPIPIPGVTPFKNLLAPGVDLNRSGHNITDAVQWVIPRHQSLITIIPPDVYLTLPTYDGVFRQPVVDGSRKNISSLSLRSINAALTISSPVLGNNQDGSSFDKSVGGFASLAGALIQVRLTVEQCKVQLYHNSADGAIPEPASAPVRRLSQVSLHLPGPEDRDDPSVADQYDEDEEDDVEVDNNSESASVSELSKFYGASVSPSTPTTAPAAKTVQQTEPPVNVFASDEKQQFLVLCVVLDNDIRKKGAADVQIQLGEARVSMDGATIASLVDGSSLVASNAKRALVAVKESFQLLALFNEKALVVDLESKAPVALLALMSENESILEEQNEESHDRLITKADHKAIVAHMNYEYWFTMLDDKLPKFVTVCTRTSRMVAEFLNATQVKDIISSKVQLKADKAAAAAPNRRRSFSLAKRISGKSKKNKGTMMKALYDIRRWGFKEGNVEELAGGRMKVEVNPVEVVFAKSNDPPFPMISLNLLGMKISVPIDDETLCHALAMFLAKEAPMFV